MREFAADARWLNSRHRANFTRGLVMLATFDRRLCAANRWCVIVMLAAMASMVFANVALRFFTDRSILWVEEVSRYR